MERTLVLIKPDGLQRGLVGEVISRLERKGLKLVGLKLFQASDLLLNEHYAHLAGQSFFPEIKQFMQSTPVVASCWEGADAVNTVRLLCGITEAREAAPGTIRGDLAMSIQCNLVHASDSVETAALEVPRFFKPEELFDFPMALLPQLYTSRESGSSR